jgi:hypothetical protein
MTGQYHHTALPKRTKEKYVLTLPKKLWADSSKKAVFDPMNGPYQSRVTLRLLASPGELHPEPGTSLLKKYLHGRSGGSEVTLDP